jgi:hypothetical protein
MLVVMQVHGLCIDEGLKSGIVVGKGSQFVRHDVDVLQFLFEVRFRFKVSFGGSRAAQGSRIYGRSSAMDRKACPVRKMRKW